MHSDNKNRNQNEKHSKKIKDKREKKVQDVIERKYLFETEKIIQTARLNS